MSTRRSGLLREAEAAALAVVAVAIVDDRLIHTEPGVSPGDHVASTLVPLALLGLVTVVASRGRPGARAAALLIAGAMAVVGGAADGVADVAGRGLAGDDLTSILALAAGVVLLVAGARTLWTSRRGGSPARRLARRAARAVAAAAFALLVLLPAAVAVVATHRPRHPVGEAALGLPHERLTLHTADGLGLAAWYVPSRNRAAVVVPSRRGGALPVARLLAGAGYGVLLFDPRGEGASDGDANAYGWRGEADVRAALDALAGRPDVDARRIGGVGLSVGGEVLLQTAARDRRLRAVVSEGAGVRSIREQRHRPGHAGWVNWISPVVVQTAATAVLSDSAPPPDLAATTPPIAPGAVLLIAARDGHDDEQLNRVYFDRAREPKALWEVPSGGHTGALRAHPGEYARRVLAFLRAALLDPHG